MDRHTLTDITPLLAKTARSAKFYVTLGNPDGTQEVLYRLNCSMAEAWQAFRVAIKQQLATRRGITPMPAWRIVRLLDHDRQLIAQES